MGCALLLDRATGRQVEKARFGVTVNTGGIINRDVAPFNNPDIRRVLGLSLDRQAFDDIISDAKRIFETVSAGGAVIMPGDIGYAAGANSGLDAAPAL